MKKQMSPLGSALFDMLTEMTGAQVKIYRRNDLRPEQKEQAAQMAVTLVEQRHRPLVLNAIKRPSRGEGIVHEQ